MVKISDSAPALQMDVCNTGAEESQEILTMETELVVPSGIANVHLALQSPRE